MGISGKNQINKDLPIILGDLTSHPTLEDGESALYFFKSGGRSELHFVAWDANLASHVAPVKITDNGSIPGGGGSGNTIHLVSSNPLDTLGVDTDLAINSVTGDLFEKSGGTWGTSSGSLKGPQGIQGIQGATGATGTTGPQGDPGVDGVGVPVGGTAGQVLKKNSATDHDTSWQNESGGGGSGDLLAANNLSDVANAATSLANLGGVPSSHLTGHAEAGAEVNAPLASQAEAEAGVENTKTMTALRTKQAIDALGGGGGGATFYTITLGPGADLATRLSHADTAAPAGWTIGDAAGSSVANIHTGSEDLMVQPDFTGSLVATVMVHQGKSSGPVQRFDLIEFDSPAQIKSKLDGSAFSMTGIDIQSDATFHVKILVQLTPVTFP